MSSPPNPAVVSTILDVIRNTGVEKHGYVAAGISRPTYYRWKGQHADFKEQVRQALIQFQVAQSVVLQSEVEAARAYLASTLARDCYQISITEYKDSSGSVLKTQVKKVQVLPPDWYLQHLVLGDEPETSDEPLKVQVTVAQPETFTPQEIEQQDTQWLDTQDQYSDFNDDADQEDTGQG